jgi:hypothetical protein
MTRSASRLAGLVVSALAFSLVATGALAADQPTREDGAAVVAAADTAQVAPAPAKRRLTTAERWRGAPYVRNAESELVRSEALDKRLPPAQPPFTSGFGLNTAGSEVLRSHALDRNIPLTVPGLVNSF